MLFRYLNSNAKFEGNNYSEFFLLIDQIEIKIGTKRLPKLIFK